MKFSKLYSNSLSMVWPSSWLAFKSYLPWHQHLHFCFKFIKMDKCEKGRASYTVQGQLFLLGGTTLIVPGRTDYFKC